jgi:hypothetical protein
MNKLAKIIISLCLVFGSGLALAQAFGPGGGGGGLSLATANSLYCRLTGDADCTMAGAITGDVAFQDSGNQIDIRDSGGVVQGSIVTASTVVRYRAADVAVLVATANRGATQQAVVLGDNATSSWVSIYGQGQVAFSPGTSLALGSPTDTTAQPNGAGSSCRMAAAGGVSAYTPSESNAVDGAFFCCTNTGTNVITMTESAGVYEGPGVASAVGQFDTVCFEYVTDRWVQRSFTDN